MYTLTPRRQASLVYDLSNGMKPIAAARKYGISQSTVYRRMRELGIERRRCVAWTEPEDELLRQHYPTRGGEWSGWKTLLPGRSPVHIRHRANKIGVRYALTHGFRTHRD